MEKIIDIIDSIAFGKGLKLEDVEEAIKESLIQTAHKMLDTSDEILIYEATINRETKELKLSEKIEVVANDDEKLTGTVRAEPTFRQKEKNQLGTLLNQKSFISIDEAKKIDKELDIGDFLNYDLEFESMGRNAATILFNNLEYRLQRYVENNLYNKYNNQVGDTILTVVTFIDKNENTFVEIGEVKGILPRKNRIKGEKFKVGDALKAVVRRVNIDPKQGLTVEISRTSPKFLESLITLEIPEVKDKRIIIENSARIPGTRAKIALRSVDPELDPIGAVVGGRGVRINAVSRQLSDEKIDCIKYTTVKEMFVARSLSPAKVKSVIIEPAKHSHAKDKAIVTITEDQKSRAIGKVGLNIRLAAMLTECDIELNVVEGITSTSISDESNSTMEQPKSTDTSSLEALFK